MSEPMHKQNTSTTTILLHALLMIMALGLTACGGGDKKHSTGPAKETFIPANFADLVAEDTEGKLVASGLVDADGNPHPLIAHSEEGVLAFYLQHPDAFHIKTPEALPEDLVWENGKNEELFSSPKAKRGGTWNDFTPDFPRTLRFVGPDANGSFRNYILDHNSIDPVVPHPNSNGFYPGCAREWAVSKDGHTAYFRIDSDARYSDGKPLLVSDFFYNLYFKRSKHISAPWYNDFYGKDKFTNMTLYDKETFSITYYKAKPNLLEKIGDTPPIPEHFYGELDDEYLEDYQWKMEPTLGAYVVLPENIEKGKTITLTRVKDWWANDKRFYRNRFNPDRIRVTVVRDPNKAFELFRKGEIDIHGLGLPEHWYDKMPDTAPEVVNGYIQKLTFFNQVPRPTYAIRIHTGKPPLDNLDVRVGLHYAMNFQLVLDKVFRGDYQRMRTVADGYGPRTHPTLKAREFSIEKAEAAFAKAGFTQRGPDGILKNASGERLTFTLTTGYKRLENVITVLKEEARKAGVELNLEILEGTAAWKKVNEKNHQLALTAFGVSVEMYPRFWEPFHSDNAYKEGGDSKYEANGSLKANLTPKTNTNNFTQMAVREFDHLINQYRESEDLGEITRLSHQMAQKVHDHANWIPGWKKPWIRFGNWRWIEFPDDWGPRETTQFEEFHVFWIDEKKKAETLDARKNGQSFPKQIRSYEKHKTK